MIAVYLLYIDICKKEISLSSQEFAFHFLYFDIRRWKCSIRNERRCESAVRDKKHRHRVAANGMMARIARAVRDSR